MAVVTGGGAVIIGGALADDAADGLSAEEDAVAAEHVDQDGTAQSVFVLMVYLETDALLGASGGRAYSNCHRTTLNAAARRQG